MDWNDVRVFLAVARKGSMRAAGRALGLSQPTIARRLAGFGPVLAGRPCPRGCASTHHLTVAEGLGPLFGEREFLKARFSASGDSPANFAELVVPELQRRGPTRDEWQLPPVLAEGKCGTPHLPAARGATPYRFGVAPLGPGADGRYRESGDAARVIDAPTRTFIKPCFSSVAAVRRPPVHADPLSSSVPGNELIGDVVQVVADHARLGTDP
jgi:Bacterial regulatory helix-turn-helix protein, lysR family